MDSGQPKYLLHEGMVARIKLGIGKDKVVSSCFAERMGYGLSFIMSIKNRGYKEK